MLRINLVFQAINFLSICRIFSEFYLRWKFMTWNLIKFPSEITLNILYSYCSYPWVLFLPKGIPNRVKSSQHIYFCVGDQLELSLYVVNGEISCTNSHNPAWWWRQKRIRTFLGHPLWNFTFTNMILGCAFLDPPIKHSCYTINLQTLQKHL